MSTRSSITFALGALLLVAGWGIPAPAAETPTGKPLVEVDPAMQARIDEAIKKGVDYLTGLLPDNKGTWPDRKGAPPGGHHPVSYAALPALTLVECGVPKNDPRIQRAAEYLRTNPQSRQCSSTYDLATAILFLDRLAEDQDKELIRTFALRLIAGQKPNGGWTYMCEPLLNDDDLAKLLTVLQHLTPKPADLVQATHMAIKQDPSIYPQYVRKPSDGNKGPRRCATASPCRVEREYPEERLSEAGQPERHCREHSQGSPERGCQSAGPARSRKNQGGDGSRQRRRHG